MTYNIACLPGDGIGPEVMAEAQRVLQRLPLDTSVTIWRIGADAIRNSGDPLPDETLDACRQADAVLKAPVGDPAYDNAVIRPEVGIFRLRAELGVYRNLRPQRGNGVDFLIVRELVGGIYYGHSGRSTPDSAFDTCSYTRAEIERIARDAFLLAQDRKAHLTLVDKANVLETSRLWREVVHDVARDFPWVRLDYMYIDNAVMQLYLDPGQFDVLLADNMFGDILSDLGGAIVGGIGLSASASLGSRRPGVFEPAHGSAPDIAGKGIANPGAMIKTVALMLRHGLGEPTLAACVETAVDVATEVAPTPDLGGSSTTRQYGDAVLRSVERQLLVDESLGPA